MVCRSSLLHDSDLPHDDNLHDDPFFFLLYDQLVYLHVVPFLYLFWL
jgi:hypothetical protein